MGPHGDMLAPSLSTLSTPKGFFFFFLGLVCGSALGHLLLKTRVGKSNLISKKVMAGVEGLE